MLGIRSAIARQIRGLLSDPANPRIEMAHDGSGLFAPDSVAWRVHIDVTGMMVGGIAALMLQMLHPKVLAGVWDHSGFRDDMNARLRGTARFIAQTTFETRASAEAQIARVRHIHDRGVGDAARTARPIRRTIRGCSPGCMSRRRRASSPDGCAMASRG